MNFEDVLIKRRSIRKYNDIDISREDINKIIWAGTLAPSAHNRQPWEVIVLKDKKSKITEIMKNYYSANPNDESINKTADTIIRCNTLLLIYCNNFEQYEYNLLSLGAMIENMILEATSLNISSVWIANVCPMEKEINQYLKIDTSRKKLVSAVALGYSDYQPKYLNRKSISEIAKYED